MVLRGSAAGTQRVQHMRGHGKVRSEHSCLIFWRINPQRSIFAA